MHGGKSLSGPAHPNYKTGKHSNVLPERMRENYERAVADEELVSLRSELAVIDARVLDLLQRADAGESGKRWKALLDQVKLVESAPDGLELHQGLKELSRMIRAGAADAYTWDEIRDWFIVRERLTRSERKRLVEAKLVMSVEQAQLVMAMFVDAAKEAVGHDPDVMDKIVDAFVRLSGHRAAIEGEIVDGG